MFMLHYVFDNALPIDLHVARIVSLMYINKGHSSENKNRYPVLWIAKVYPDFNHLFRHVLIVTITCTLGSVRPRDTFGSSSGKSRLLPNYLPVKKLVVDLAVAEPLGQQVGWALTPLLTKYKRCRHRMWRNSR